MTRWLRHKTDGTIYEWDKYLDKHPKLEEVSEEVPAAEEVADIVAALEAESEDTSSVAKSTRKGKKRKGVDLHTDDIPEEPEYTNDELNREASRGL